MFYASTPTSGCFQTSITTLHDLSRPFMTLHAGNARPCTYLYSSSFTHMLFSFVIDPGLRRRLVVILCCILFAIKSYRSHNVLVLVPPLPLAAIDAIATRQARYGPQSPAV